MRKSPTRPFANLKRKHATAERSRPTPLPLIESVEPRRLMSASLAGGTLTVNGTQYADNILINSDGTNILVTRNNNSEGTFSFASVQRIVVNAGAESDQVTIRPDGQDFMGTMPPCTLNGGEGNDSLNGGSGNDFLNGENGNDELSGKAGDDLLDGGAGADKMFGGNGTDTADYSSRGAGHGVTVTLDNVANDGESGEGDNVKDTIENVNGGAGNDNISSPASMTTNNSFFGGDGNDSLSGGGGDDSLDGWNGHDVLDGGDGNDWIAGWTGYDVLRGGAGNDQLYGEQDGDTLNGGLGADLLDGGDGDDVADYSDRTENLNISLDGVANDGVPPQTLYYDLSTRRFVRTPGEGDNVLTEHVWGGSGNDTITAPATDMTTNVFIGNGGNDYLDGGGGSDYLYGMAGDDILIGNDGWWDNLTGGDGNDLVKADSFDYQNGNEGVWSGLIIIPFP